MFGYVKPNNQELKIKHFNLYRSFYCGVCKAIGERYRQLPRLMLNYDLTFFAVFLSGVFGEFKLREGRCAVKGFKKCPNVVGEFVDLAADLNVILAYCKFKDDFEDERSIQSIIGKGVFKSDYKKVLKRHPEVVKKTSEMFEKQLELERLECWSVDIAAEPFAEYMSFLVSYAFGAKKAERDENAEMLFNLLGRWIYIIDAVDDYEKDVKEDKYNVFKYAEGGIASADKSLFLCLNSMYSAFSKIKFENNDLKIIVENVILSGLLLKTDEVLKIRKCKDE